MVKWAEAEIQRVQMLISHRAGRSESGQDLVEYALMAGFVALAAAATIPYVVEGPMRSIYDGAVNLLQQSGGG
jgi:Flp pilus assembly pilin Flp